ncbi:MAG: glycosyltransferase family 4 protein [Armatimonadota bacterium]|nr:glycosyltransferase family 4 protein [Armatimonadota bacterium]
MKVLHIGLACAFGGAETFLSTLVREQRKVGIEADVFFTTDLGASSQFSGLCRVGFADRELLAEALLRGGYDILHLSNHAVPWTVRTLRLIKCDVPIVVTYHSLGRYESKISADAIVAVSNAVADHLRSQCGRPIRVIYNGVDTHLFSPGSVDAPARPIMAWVGRSNDQRKDVAGLVAVASCSFAREFQVVVVDGSPPGEEFSPHWLPKDAIIEVRKPYAEMPGFYRKVVASKGFLLSTSRSEAHPVNILEAQACGCPVIAPSVGGIPETVEHLVTGFVYDLRGGVDAVREGVEWLYSGDNYSKASQAAIQRIRAHFSSERMCREYSDLYTELIGSRRRSLSRKLYQIALRPALPLVRSAVLAYQRSKR